MNPSIPALSSNPPYLQSVNRVGLNFKPFLYWSRDVFWLGQPYQRCPNQNISQIQILRHLGWWCNVGVTDRAPRPERMVHSPHAAGVSAQSLRSWAILTGEGSASDLMHSTSATSTEIWWTSSMDMCTCQTDHTWNGIHGMEYALAFFFWIRVVIWTQHNGAG